MSSRVSRALLLDTCTLLDLSIDANGSASRIAKQLLDFSDRLFVSAASAWEISIKTSAGRLSGGELLVTQWDENLTDLQIQPLEISHADARLAGALDWSHRDPFDRMLVAQTKRHGFHLATRDRQMLSANIVDTIDASS